VKFAVLICYDQWFPEAAREARLRGAEVIFYPTAIGDIIGYKPEGDWHDAWETSMRGHAIANSLYVAAINRVGIEGKMKFFGQSFVADPFGKILKRASKDKEEILIQKLDLSKNKFFADGWGFLRNRRPDTYKNIVSKKLTKKSKKLPKVDHYEDEKRALKQS
jgi:agmatine deiminase